MMWIKYMIEKARIKKQVRSSWVDIKLFDFKMAQQFFSENLASLEYGALGIIEDEDVIMEVVRDGKFVTSLQGITKCDGVEFTVSGTPCIKCRFYHEEDRIIASYVRGEYNTMAHEYIKHYTGNLNNGSVVRVFETIL